MADDSKNEAAVYSAALELVVAVAENDVIGRGNALPWHLPLDLQHFKALTLGRDILMGRRTYESIGKALPGRTNYVLTRSARFNPGDCKVVRSIDEARGHSPLLMVIGGAEVYRASLPTASCIHLTLVHARIEAGDTFFPEWRSGEFREVFREEHAADARNAHACSFITLRRREPPREALR